MERAPTHSSSVWIIRKTSTLLVIITVLMVVVFAALTLSILVGLQLSERVSQ